MLDFIKRDIQIERECFVNIKSPIVGCAMELDKVPDDVFSSKMMGDGIAIEPKDGILYAPVDGRIINVFPTGHALGIETNDGLEILIHIGIDTVFLKGKGFESMVKENDIVKMGDKLISFDLEMVRNTAKSTAVVMIVTNMDCVDSMKFNYGMMDTNSDVMIVKKK